MNRQETEAVLKEYAGELRENLNLRLFCETGQNISLWETILQPREVLWVEEVVLMGITYPEERKNKTGNKFKGIRKLFRRIQQWISKIF